MGTSLFPQPPENETDLKNWRKDIQNTLHGEENAGGKLNGKNITNITDPGAVTLSTVSVDSADASDLATVIVLANEMKADLNTLVTDINNGFTKFNSLLSEIRDTLELFG